MMLCWNPCGTPVEVHALLEALSEEYAIRKVDAAEKATLVLIPSGEKNFFRTTCRNPSVFQVEYNRICDAARGIGFALAGLEGGAHSPFDTLGVLFDATRGNVITVPSFKRWLRRAALFGYNLGMIYTKDMYRLPEEPYFGYMRGAYSLDEMREIDAYAGRLGIEMIASIQALGHMEPILRWPAYSAVRDTEAVMMVDEPATERLLEKILNFWSEAFSSRRIHLGMDETHDLGRGRYMDRHGYESPFRLYNRHLKRVLDLCGKHAFRPIIWSDMYFRYANPKQDYYDMETVVPEEVRQAIPANVQLSYWDYYHRQSDPYETMLRRTSALNGSTPFMASGIWTWFSLWTDYEMTKNTVKPCLDACRKVGARELIFTLWGDDGGYCEFDSAFAALAWCADSAFHGEASDTRIPALFHAVCGASYADQILAGGLEYTFPSVRNPYEKIRSAQLLWDDPLMAMIWRELPALKPSLREDLIRHYRTLREQLHPLRNEVAAGRLDHAWAIADVLVRKLELRQLLERAWTERDFPSLKRLREENIPGVLDSLERLKQTFRVQWLRSFKSYGLEVMQIRLAGLQERYRELERILSECESGIRTSIPELEEEHHPSGALDLHYRMIATGGWYI